MLNNLILEIEILTKRWKQLNKCNYQKREIQNHYFKLSKPIRC